MGTWVWVWVPPSRDDKSKALLNSPAQEIVHAHTTLYISNKFETQIVIGENTPGAYSAVCLGLNILGMNLNHIDSAGLPSSGQPTSGNSYLNPCSESYIFRRTVNEGSY